MSLPFVEEVADYLVTKSLGTKQTDLVIEFMPDVSGDPITVLRDSPGPSNHPGSLIRQPAVQVVVRGSTFAIARQRAAKIYNVLHGMTGINFTNNRVFSSRATSLPTTMGPDTRGRHEVVCIYEFLTRAIGSSGAASAGIGGDKDPNLN